MGKAAKGTRKMAKKGLVKSSFTAPKNKTNKLKDKERERATKQKEKRKELRDAMKEEKKTLSPEEKRKRGFEIQEAIKERRREARAKFESMPKAQQKKFLEDRRLKKRRNNYDLEKDVGKLYAELINVQKQGWDPSFLIEQVLEMVKESTVTLNQFAQCKIGSRALQACLKWGNGTQRLAIAQVVEANFHDMLLGKFSHMVLLKVFKYVAKHDKGTDPVREKKFIALVKMLSGKILRKAFGQKFGCAVINQIYHMEKVSKTEQRRLLNEIIVPQIVALQVPGLEINMPTHELLKLKMDDKMKKQLIENLRDLCNRCIDKELLGFGMAQTIFDTYTQVATEDQLKDLIDRVVEGIPHLLASKQGVNAFVRLLGVASAKHRKGIIKALKGQWVNLSQNDVDVAVVLRLLTTVDDTVLLNKSVLVELEPSLAELASNDVGRKVILTILVGATQKYLSPAEHTLVSLPAPTSVKEPEARKKQLCDHFLPVLKKAMIDNISTFLSDSCAKDVLVEYLIQTRDDDVFKALCDALNAAMEKEDALLEKSYLSQMLNRLLRDKEAGVIFAPILFAVLKDFLEVSVGSRLSFVLLDLLKHTVEKDLLALCKEQETALVEATQGSGGKKFLEEVDKKLGTEMASKVVLKEDAMEVEKEDEESDAMEVEEQTVVVPPSDSEEEEEDSDEEMEFVGDDDEDSGSD